MTAGQIVLKGARQHNLKNVDVRLPRHRLIVITGPSGSGKSSLAFDTLYAEGQRRYLESLSAFARQFLEQVPKPDVDRVEGLSPALAIDQKGLGHNPRSTVGTVTEVLPFLRLLYARLGTPFCPDCEVEIAAGHPSRILADLQALPPGTRATVLAPVLHGRRGEQRKLLADLRRRGYVRVRLDGEILALDDLDALPKGHQHHMDAVVDRLVAGKGAPGRLQRSVEKALADGKGQMRLLMGDGEERLYSDKLACPDCGRGFAALEPRVFSFNSPAGACPDCRGLGKSRRASEQLLVPDGKMTLRDGALAPLRGRAQSFANQQVEFLAEALGFSMDVPYVDLPAVARRALLEGTEASEFSQLHERASGHEKFLADFEGLRALVERRAERTKSTRIKTWCESFMEEVECAACEGTRLGTMGRSVKVHGVDLATLCKQSLHEMLASVADWKFEGASAAVGVPLLAEVVSRVGFLQTAGLGYLELRRSVTSLSGGEGQRVRLATQVGGRLTGVLYVLDEPSVGLHPRDTQQLIGLLRELCDRGNTVVVVEHDRDVIEAADHVVDMGPHAGERGGEVVAEGTPEQIERDPNSPTGVWLSQKRTIARRPARPREQWLTVRGMRWRNLKSVDMSIPLQTLVAVTGVSGSGKTTAVHDILFRALAARYHGALTPPGTHEGIDGTEYLRKVILIDQQPIGRSPRSTPATFTGLYTHLRKLLAGTPAARSRGFGAGRFSFNTKGGRCEACSGAGVQTLTMDFLPEVQVRCELCRGSRFNRQTLEVTYKGRSISNFLDMEVAEAYELLEPIPQLERILRTLKDVGLGYLRLGQPADTVSGGEAQRLKLARELSRPASGDTLFLLDEPTTGLHFQDVEMLLEVLHRLVDRGNTVLVIEHHSDVILAADHVIDMGPEGGFEGGEIVVAGRVDEVVECPASYTGQMLRRQRDALSRS